jgi:hypothetical protein
MSPTVFQYKEYRFYFFSREEVRMHVHVFSPNGEAKFWLEPVIMMAEAHRLNAKQLRIVKHVVEEHKNEIEKSWKKHFKH